MAKQPIFSSSVPVGLQKLQAGATGIVPIYDPNRGFRVWGWWEIFGKSATGAYVPNVDDAAIDWDNGPKRCVQVDTSTGNSEWIDVDITKQSGIDFTDVLLGTGPGYNSETYRCYINASNATRITLAVDSRLRCYGSTNTYCKIFLGTDVSDTGEVISVYYDQSGVASENIPLELVAMPNGTGYATTPMVSMQNLAVKAPITAWCSQPLDDGEVVTLVTYADTVGMTSKSKLLIKNTAFVRGGEDTTVFITGLSLDTPFLSLTDDHVIQYPMNMPVDAMSMMGVVSYSTGGTRRIPIDQQKLCLYGLDTYVATILGQKIPLTLTYRLDSTETCYSASLGEGKTMSVDYWAQTVEADGTYVCKLYILPMWIDEHQGYGLDFYLYNLDRQTFYQATPYVEIGINSAPYDPLKYGVTQNITVAIDINKCDSTLANYRYVQTFGITLMQDGLSEGTPWYVRYSPGQDPQYGGSLEAWLTHNGEDDWSVDLSCKAASQDDWFQRLYYGVQPLFMQGSETEAPLPTHFNLNVGNILTEFSVSQWNQALKIITGGTEGDSLVIEWMRKVDGESTLQLAASPVIIRHVDTNGGGDTVTV